MLWINEIFLEVLEDIIADVIVVVLVDSAAGHR